MQKLASSSVAAIRSAIEGRLSRMVTEDGRLASLRNERDWLISHRDLSEPDMADELARMDEEIVATASHLRLMKNEEPALRNLLEAAQRVTSETKILRVMDEIERRFRGRNVLLFTEYKATQSLVMSELMKRYGRQCVTFINGDEQVVNVRLPNGDVEKSIKQPRTEAAEAFNSGEVRFLVSTEAGGEGIDLQDNCLGTRCDFISVWGASTVTARQIESRCCKSVTPGMLNRAYGTSSTRR
jgi:ERCC4-related helicase